MMQPPIFHVNGDDPEAAYACLRIALDFRQEFNRDVVIDLICFRRLATTKATSRLTQPDVQARQGAPGVRTIYAQRLVREGDIDREEVEEMMRRSTSKLQEALDRTKETSRKVRAHEAGRAVDRRGRHRRYRRTGVARHAPKRLGTRSAVVPEGFTSIRSWRAARAAREDGRRQGADGLGHSAEQIAFGSLLLEGYRVRLSGQDSGRGTFCHRHAVMYDTRTGEAVDAARRAAARAKQARASTCSTALLSEYGVLGFDYGYSVAAPDALVIWEAQFGDFINGAQIIIDQFIAAAEEKWRQHSRPRDAAAARLRRTGAGAFQRAPGALPHLCAEGNMQVCYPTTPAQYFHALRRQMKHRLAQAARGDDAEVPAAPSAGLRRSAI